MWIDNQSNFALDLPWGRTHFATALGMGHLVVVSSSPAFEAVRISRGEVSSLAEGQVRLRCQAAGTRSMVRLLIEREVNEGGFEREELPMLRQALDRAAKAVPAERVIWSLASGPAYGKWAVMLACPAESGLRVFASTGPNYDRWTPVGTVAEDVSPAGALGDTLWFSRPTLEGVELRRLVTAP